MRVLEVVHGFPPSAQGGAELYAAAHARELARAGDEVVVVSREADVRRADFSVREEIHDGCRVFRINQTFRSVRSFEESYRCEPIRALVAARIAAFRPEVAHLHHLTCLSTGIVHELARRAVPMVYTLHDYWLLCHRGQLLDRGLRRCPGPGDSGCGNCVGAEAGMGRAAYAAAGWASRLPAPLVALLRRTAARRSGGGSALAAERSRRREMREVCSRIDRFLGPSAHIRDRFVAAGIEPARIELAGYGVDPAPFGHANRTASAQLRVGYLGSLMVSKGTRVLLEAFSRLPPERARLDLHGAFVAYHGDESYRHELDPLLHRRDILWHGPLEPARVPAVLAALDVLVVPSIWEENSPFVVREAFLAGVPVVGSRIGGIPELVEHERSGLLVEPGDPAALANALQRLLDEPELLARLRRGIPPVRTLADDVARAREVYRELVERTRLRGA